MKRIFLIVGGLAVIVLGIVYVTNTIIIPSTTVIEQMPTEESTAQSQPTAVSENRSFTEDDIAKTGKPQFLDAFAPWCPACQHNEPSIFSLRRQFKDRVDFIFLNVDLPGVLDAAIPYSLTGMTQYVLISEEGEIIEKWFGSISEEAVAESIDNYLESL
jgi:thiol:disulfide interchange protein